MLCIGLWAAIVTITGCIGFYLGRRSALLEGYDDDVRGWEGTDGGDD